MTLYGNFNHMYKVVYTQKNGNNQYNYSYILMMQIELVVEFVLLLWNIVMIWLFYILFVIPYLLLNV